jgi:hypothetical protein
MRKIFERAVKGRLFGLKALQKKVGRVGGPVEAVAECWRGYCRVCLGAVSREQPVHFPSIGSFWPPDRKDDQMHVTFDQAFLRRCGLAPPKTSLPIHLHQARSQGTHQIANAEVQHRLAVSIRGVHCALPHFAAVIPCYFAALRCAGRALVRLAPRHHRASDRGRHCRSHRPCAERARRTDRYA